MNMIIWRWLAVLLALGFSVAAPGQREPIPGQLIVRLRADYSPSALRGGGGTLSASAGIAHERPIAPQFNIHLFRYDTAFMSGEVALALVRRHKAVLAAQFNRELQWRHSPNDPEYDRQWSLPRIQAPQVWQYTTGGRTARGDEIVVAVLDGGFDLRHEDFRDNLWFNPGERPGDGIDNDGNGYIDDVNGWNFVENKPEHRVDQHGQSVAGIIGAKGNNGIGVTGLNWRVQIMPLSVRFVDQIIAAYAYVIDQRSRYNKTDGRDGAFVVATNASFGIDRVFCEEEPVWGQMYDLLGAVGVLTGAGAANADWNVDEVGDMPTTCPSPYLISVLNTNGNDERHPSSAYGSRSIEMGAPGQNSYTTKPGDNYGLFNANSAAAPHLTGAIGLLYSLPCPAIAELSIRNPPQMAKLIREALLAGVDPQPSLREYTTTGGRLNIFRAMEQLQDFCGASSGPLNIMRVYPNPAGQFTRVEYESPDFEPLVLRVFNSMGQFLYQETISPSRFGIKQHRLDIPPNWTAGIYFVSLQHHDKWVTQRFVVHY
jgi:hypothetical protein